MEKHNINILHVYPSLLNLYGDKGNIQCLKNRMLWRDIDVNINILSDENQVIDFENTDIIFLGGGSDIQQKEVLEKLLKYKEGFLNYIESGKTFVVVCGGFSLICKSLFLCGEKMDGLSLVDAECEPLKDKNRISGNIILNSNLYDGKIVGFENRECFISNNKYTNLGTVLKGSGSDAENKTEGLVYKNLVATFLHGPLFPKNPKLCDYVILNAVKNKYPDFKELKIIDDTLENAANDYVVRTYSKETL